MQLLIATTNAGKVREIRAALAASDVDLLTLTDPSIGPIAEPEETGRTFADNAALKALYYASKTGLATVADDSGLAIDALGGRPGVESARYPGATYPDKFANLYRELAPHPRPWTARFVCAVAFVNSRPTTSETVAFACEGTVEGEITDEPRGTFGFGYDPVFYYPPYWRTLGDVPDDLKLAVSHRGEAFRQFSAWLRNRAGT